MGGAGVAFGLELGLNSFSGCLSVMIGVSRWLGARVAGVFSGYLVRVVGAW